MHGRHLTRNGSAWVFQMRVPRAYDFMEWLTHLRITIGPVDKRTAQGVARVLSLSAHRALGEAQDRLMMAGTGNDDALNKREAVRRDVYDRIGQDLQQIMPAFAALDEGLPDLQSTPQDRARTIYGLLTALGELPASKARVTPPDWDERAAEPPSAADWAKLRRTIGLPPAPDTTEAKLDQIMATVRRLENRGLRELPAASSGPVIAPAIASASRAPLFSKAADSYHERLRATHGDHYDELKYIRHRKQVFLAICGDRPVDRYTSDDLQHFINRVRFLPPNHSKQKNFTIATIDRLIDAQEASGQPGLSESTLVNNYLGKVKTILRHGCASVAVPFALEKARIIIPKGVPKARQKFLPAHDDMNRIFRIGVESGLLADTMLPLLGFLTGRRLGLMVFLHGGDIRQEHGCWIVTPRSHVEVNGQLMPVPIKTSESLGAYVLHDFLAEIGFVDWVRARPRFVFEALHETQDPADTASKRLARLFRSAGLDPETHKAFHGLRHLKIAESRDAGIDARTTRLQVGHELGSVHDRYGGTTMRPSEMQLLARAALPTDIDWSVFRNLDYDRLALARPHRGVRRAGNGGAVQ